MTDSTTSFEQSRRLAKISLPLLLVIFILGTLCLQAFNLVFQQIGSDVGAPAQASLITALPGVVLGIVCFIYGSLGDFVSLRTMMVVGFLLLLAGSFLGFFFHANIWIIIVARMIQTAGAQVSGSIYLVIASKYLRDDEKVIYFGVFTAGYQLSTAIGVLAAGYLSEIDWAYLFLIPAISIVCIPFLLKNLPTRTTKSFRIDVPGFVLFGVMIGMLTLFFNDLNFWWLAGAGVLLIVFIVYINRASMPFITPNFFRNSRYLMAVSLIFIFYFFNYSLSPIFNGIGSTLYGMKTSQVSLMLLAAYLVATVVATSSGKIVQRIGHTTSIVVAGSLMCVGLFGASLLVTHGSASLAISAAVFYAGMGLLYSPIVDTVLGTLPVEESGRGIGMNDLVMNVTASIGIALFGMLMTGKSLAGGSVSGQQGAAATYSNLLLIGAGICLLGLVVFGIVRRRVYSKN